MQDRTPGEPFVPKAAKEAEMEKLMKSMQVWFFYRLKTIRHGLLPFFVEIGIILLITQSFRVCQEHPT